MKDSPTSPKSKAYPSWGLRQLHDHLQYMVDLEFWTIPYYLTAMYSIKDRTDPAFTLIQSVVNEEMFHVQLASNIANAFGLTPTFKAPVYRGNDIPHIDFSLDTPNPTAIYSPYSAELGPLDQTRINTMCLIEYPEWDTGQGSTLHADVTTYGSIGALYESMRYAASLFQDQIVGGVNQVNMFANYFNQFEHQTVTLNGREGLKQIYGIMSAIVEQGEGKTEGAATIPPEFQNTAASTDAELDHFTKFELIRKASSFPAVYRGVRKPDAGSAGARAQAELIKGFDQLCATMEKLFSGQNPPRFGRQMSAVGAFMSNCWQNGAEPRIS